MEIEKKSIYKRNRFLSQEETTGYLADFSSNQTQSELFPFTIWTKMVREVSKRQPDAADDQSSHAAESCFTP